MANPTLQVHVGKLSPVGREAISENQSRRPQARRREPWAQALVKQRIENFGKDTPIIDACAGPAYSTTGRDEEVHPDYPR